MQPIEVVKGGPLEELLLAINHYISTGDHAGEGVIIQEEGEPERLTVLIAVNPALPVDLDDFSRFSSRIAEILAGRPEISLTFEGGDARFRFHYLRVPEADIHTLAADLVRSPGAAGWGSVKADIDRAWPELRGKILSGEGI